MKLTADFKSPKSILLLLLFIAAQYIIFILTYRLSLTSFNAVFQVDFIQYWSSAKLFISGQNPYDIELNYQLQKSVWSSHRIAEEPVMCWAPPIVFIFTFWLGFLDYLTAKSVWAVIQINALFFGSLMIYRSIIQDTLRARFYFALLSLCFAPFLILIWFGQIGFLFLIYAAIVLKALKDKDFCDSEIIGIATLLTLIKPHYFYPLYIALLFSSIISKKYKTLTTLAVLTPLLILITYFIQPSIFSFYLNAEIYTSITFFSSSIPDLLAYYLEIEPIQTLRLSLITIGTFLAWKFTVQRRNINQDYFIFLLLLTPFISPYIWIFDYLVLYPFFLNLVLSPNCKTIHKIIFLFINLFTLAAFMQSFVKLHHFIFYPVLLLLIVMLDKQHNQDSQTI